MNGSSNNGIRASQKIAQINDQYQQLKWFIGILTGIFTSFIIAMLIWIKVDVNRNEQTINEVLTSIKSDVNRNERTINEMNMKIARVETDLSWIKSLLKPSVSGQVGKN